MGPESYHAMSDFNALMSNDPDIDKGGFAGHLQLRRHRGAYRLGEADVQLTFERNYPDRVKEKVRANWKKWGLPELNDPDNETRRGSYFETTGKGETGRRG